MPSTTSYNLPLTESTFTTSPDQLRNFNLLPTTVTTPSPTIPPLMANIVATPEDHLPPTRQGVLPPPQRPTAADFFSPPPPTLENIADEDPQLSSPPRPTTPVNPPPSPIAEDPTTVSFPSTQITTTLQEFRERYELEFDVEMDFSDFESLTRQFTTDAVTLAKDISANQRPRPAPRRPDRPSARPPIDYRKPSSSDPAAARRLQHLYRVSKKRAARKIFGDDNPGFDGTLEEATSYFTESFGPRECNTTRLLENLETFVPQCDPDSTLFEPPTPAELSQKLRNLANSAPGQDRLEYRHLRLLDPNAKSLQNFTLTVSLPKMSLRNGKPLPPY